MPYREKPSVNLMETFVEQAVVLTPESPIHPGNDVKDSPVLVSHTTSSFRDSHLHIKIPPVPCELEKKVDNSAENDVFNTPDNDVFDPPENEVSNPLENVTNPPTKIFTSISPSNTGSELSETSRVVPSPSDSDEDISECDTAFLRNKISIMAADGFVPRRKTVSLSEPVSPGRLERCDLCGKTFNSVPALRRHVMIHSRQRSLDLPSKRYSESAQECTQCGKLFENAAYLEKHKLNRHSAKKFKCDVCGNQFTTKPLRDNHRRTHFGENPFACTII